MAISRSIGIILFVTMMVTLNSASCVAETAAEGAARVVVAVVEPGARDAGAHQLGYSVSVGKSRFTTGDEVLNGLAETKGNHLAILAREDVSMGAIPFIAALASKAGFLRYTVFVFDLKREGMSEIPSFKWFDFSTDPATIGALVR